MNGMEWNGMEWNGMEYLGKSRHRRLRSHRHEKNLKIFSLYSM